MLIRLDSLSFCLLFALLFRTALSESIPMESNRKISQCVQKQLFAKNTVSKD
jgi:hypothetical protein